MSAPKRIPVLWYLLLWIAFIVLVGVLPLRNFVGHSHWEYIKWLPTAEDLISPKYLVDIGSDLVGNTLLFLPLGFFLSRLLSPASVRRQLLVAACVSGLLSFSIEFYQVYCHNRFPSFFDVITNITGAFLGIWCARRNVSIMHQPRPASFTPIPPDRTLVP